MSDRNWGGEPFSFSRAERVALLTLLLVGVVGLASGYWLPRLLAPAPGTLTLDSAYVAEANAWVALAAARADSVAEAREARRARARERQAAYEARRRQWDAEREARAARRARYERGDYRRDGNYADRSRWSTRADGTPAERRRSESTPEDDADGPPPPPGSLDPNTVDSATLRRLGLPIGLTRRWLKYRASGGSFVSAGDIAKLYGMPDSTAARIEGYFADPPPRERSPAGETPAERRRREPPAELEINHATAEDLESLRGIGSYYASRIIEYRGRLGGFVSVAQVAETPGLRDSAFAGIAGILRVDTSYRYRIALNRATRWQELRHPYMSTAAAKMTFNYREQHGPYRSTADLSRVKALRPADIAALAPYLDFGL